jgi:CHASE3 domain sensor protein
LILIRSSNPARKSNAFKTRPKEGKAKMIRKAALQLGTFALLALMGWNAYLFASRLNDKGKVASLILESSRMQAGIAAVLRNLTDMETGQRGYLLTSNDGYLLPYTDAQKKVAGDFAALRVALAMGPQGEQAMESQLESLASSKQAEMERTISLRKAGYRHRAFKLVNSDEGLQYMDKIRALLSSLSTSENGTFTKLEAEKNERLEKSFREIIITNICMFALAGCLFAGMRYHGHMLENDAAQSRHELMLRDVQLRKLTSALSTQARVRTSTIEQNAYLLLENYGDFLPRQGHEYAEQIKEASAQMERLRQDLVAEPDANSPDQPLYESVA